MNVEKAVAVLDATCNALKDISVKVLGPEILEGLSRDVRKGLSTQVQMSMLEGGMHHALNLAGFLFGSGYRYIMSRGLGEDGLPCFFVDFVPVGREGDGYHVAGGSLERTFTLAVLSQFRDMIAEGAS